MSITCRTGARCPAHRVLIGLIASTALLCAACGSSAGAGVRHSVSPMATSSTPVPSVLPDPAIARALAAYNGMWADEQVAARTANDQSPLLPQHASGAALSLLVRGLYSYRLKHLVINGQLVTHPTVTSLSPPGNPTRAAVLDCSDDSRWLVYRASGGLENNVPGGHRRVTAVVQNLSGVWKVTQLNTGAEGTC